jgi:localization factor PodJL
MSSTPNFRRWIWMSRGSERRKQAARTWFRRPDLNAIMRRVRDSRGEAGTQAEAEAAKTDFIAAARRAAQAAAAEADAIKRNAAAPEVAGKGILCRRHQARRKPILMAAVAVMIALTGLQLASLSSRPDQSCRRRSHTSSSDATEGEAAGSQQLSGQSTTEESSAVRQAEQNLSTGETAQTAAADQGEPMAGSPAVDPASLWKISKRWRQR